MLFGYRNAFYDAASVYTWDKVYMQTYIEELLDELSKIMPNFSSYNFYFLHATEGIIPYAITDCCEKKILQTGDQLGYEPIPEVMNSFYYIFKTHLRYQTGKYTNISPFPLGLPSKTPILPIKPMSERKFNVFYSGNINNNRIGFYLAINHYEKNVFKRLIGYGLISVIRILSKSDIFKSTELRVKSLLFKLHCYNYDEVIPNSYIRFTRAFQAGLNVDDYAKMLADSKIILSPRGFFNTECFRFYEALRQGCVVITEPQPKTSPFYNNKFYIEVENWNNMREIVQGLLDNPSKLQQMSEVGVAYYNRCLSPRGVANYVKDTLVNYKK